MTSFLSKLRSKSEPVTSSQRKDLDTTTQEENTLADEQDAITENLSGTLQLSDDLLKTPTDPNQDFSFALDCEGSSPTRNNISFEVISAEVIREGRSGHVNYKVLINPHTETSKGRESVITRRYSDFEGLHQRLKKRYPAPMSQISFPRKVLTGNFTSSTIAKRSTAFEQYLTHLFSNFDIRYSREFMEFFVRDDFSSAVQYFLSSEFQKSAVLFERALPILDKLYGDSHPHVLHSLCALVVCHSRLERLQLALTCANVALSCSGSADDEVMIALLQGAIRLSWTLGKDKTDMEKKLEVLKSKSEKSLGQVVSVKDLADVLTDTFKLRTRH